MVVEKEKEKEIILKLSQLDTNLRIEGYKNIKLYMIRAKNNIIGNLKLLNKIKSIPEEYHFFKKYKDSKDILYYIDKFNKICNLAFKESEKTKWLLDKNQSKKIFDNIYPNLKYDFDLLYRFCSISQNLFELYELDDKITYKIFELEKEKKDTSELEKELQNINETLKEVQLKHHFSEINFLSDFVQKNDIRLFETIESEV